MAYKSFLTMEAGEQDKFVRQADQTIKETKHAREVEQASNPRTGKLICAIECRLESAKANNTVARNTTLAMYWKAIVGSTKAKVPTHALTCAVTFGTLVLSEHLTEKDYDLCSSNMIELAGEICNVVAGDIAHPILPKVCKELKERSKDAMKNLRALKLEVKPREPMDAETAQKKLAEIFGDGHLNLVIAEMAAQMCYLDHTNGESPFLALLSAGVLVDRHFGPQAEVWTATFSGESAETIAKLQKEADTAREQAAAAKNAANAERERVANEIDARAQAASDELVAKRESAEKRQLEELTGKPEDAPEDANEEAPVIETQNEPETVAV